MKRTPLARKTPLVSKILPRQTVTLKTRAPMPKRRCGQRRTEAARSENWLTNVREIGLCMRCGAFGVEAAHRDFGKGFGQKTDDCATAALCPKCHFDLGNGRELDRATRRAEMDRCIVDTLIQLARAGKVLAV
jgi:hypothetical protein